MFSPCLQRPLRHPVFRLLRLFPTLYFWICFLKPRFTTNLIFRSENFSDSSVIILAFGAQNITKEPHWHRPAQLSSPSFSDSVHRVTNAVAYCLVYVLPLGFSNHYPPHLCRVWLDPSPPRPFFTLLANSGNFLDISFILHCVLHVGCDNFSDWVFSQKFFS